MSFPLSWPERLYGLVLMAYPQSFREEYEYEMRLVFRDLLGNPDFGAWRLTMMVVRDLVAGILHPARLPDRGLIARGALFGLILVALSLAAQLLHPGRYIGIPLVASPFIAFLPATFWGARHARSFAGGIWLCFVMGAVASTLVLWDWLMFASFPFYSVFDFALAMLMMVGFCLGPSIVGAAAGVISAPRASRPKGAGRRLPAQAVTRN